jgi:phosphoheptose isomerase
MSDNAWLTAESNDTNYGWAVSRIAAVEGLPRPSMLIMLSGSGMSENLFSAVASAQLLNPHCVLVGLLGWIRNREGGDIADSCDHKVVVCSDDYGVVEDVHSSLVHFIHRALTT